MERCESVLVQDVDLCSVVRELEQEREYVRESLAGGHVDGGATRAGVVVVGAGTRLKIRASFPTKAQPLINK